MAWQSEIIDKLNLLKSIKNIRSERECVCVCKRGREKECVRKRERTREREIR